MNLPSFAGSAGDAECARLAELAVGKRVLELGSLVGRSTIAMARQAQSVVSIDLFQGGTRVQFHQNLVAYGVSDKVESFVGDTHALVPTLLGRYDMAFIDADHSYEGAYRDLVNVARVIEPDGVIACHDYVDLWGLNFGVDRAVDQFCSETDWRVTEVIESLAVLRRNPSNLVPIGEADAIRLRGVLSQLLAALGDRSLNVRHDCIGERCRYCDVLSLVRNV